MLEAMIESPGGRSGYELRRDLHQSQRSVALSTADSNPIAVSA